MRLLLTLILLFLPLAGCLDVSDRDDGGREHPGYTEKDLQALFHQADGDVSWRLGEGDDSPEAVLLEVVPHQAERAVVRQKWSLDMANPGDMGYGVFHNACSVTAFHGNVASNIIHPPRVGTFVRTPAGDVDGRATHFGYGSQWTAGTTTRQLDAHQGFLVLAALEDAGDWVDRGGYFEVGVEQVEPVFHHRLLDTPRLDCLTDLSQTTGGTIAETPDAMEASNVQWSAPVDGAGFAVLRVGADRAYEYTFQAPARDPHAQAYDAGPLSLTYNASLVFLPFWEPGEVHLELTHMQAVAEWELSVVVIHGMDPHHLEHLLECEHGNTCPHIRPTTLGANSPAP